jgi:hypothetical protein
LCSWNDVKRKTESTPPTSLQRKASTSDANDQPYVYERRGGESIDSGTSFEDTSPFRIEMYTTWPRKMKRPERNNNAYCRCALPRTRLVNTCCFPDCTAQVAPCDDVSRSLTNGLDLQKACY